jgi:hypothetical protein
MMQTERILQACLFACFNTNLYIIGWSVIDPPKWFSWINSEYQFLCKRLLTLHDFCISRERQMTIRLNVQDEWSWEITPRSSIYPVTEIQIRACIYNPWIERKSNLTTRPPLMWGIVCFTSKLKVNNKTYLVQLFYWMDAYVSWF